MKKTFKHLKVFMALLTLLLLIPQTTAVSKKISKPKSDQIESITVDCALSVGGCCMCARHLENNNLRRFASPLDWMTSYSIDTAAYFFETKFEDFFENVKVIGDRKDGNREVYDTKNHIKSIHYMPTSVPFDEAYKEFKETMQRRAKKVDEVLSTSKSVLLVNCRGGNSSQNSTDDELKEFAKRFSKIYPNLDKIYLMDIHNNDSMKIRKRIIQNDKKIKIIQYQFKNIDKKLFHPDWLGNKVAWNKIMKPVRLTQNISDDKKIHATLFS